MKIFAVSNLAKDLDIPIQGVHDILIGPVGQFQSVTKGVQNVQRGSLDAQECNPCVGVCRPRRGFASYHGMETKTSVTMSTTHISKQTQLMKQKCMYCNN